MKDTYGREIEYMRISITDRCNLRCQYCMPYGIQCTSMDQILTLEEIETVVRSAAKLGIKYIKITGGEPLVRLNCCHLIKMIKAVDGIEKVTITTNGVLLNQYLDDLIEAQIDGINISLDTLDPFLYEQLTGADKLQDVFLSIQRAIKEHIVVKINAVSIDLNSFAKERHIEIAQDYWKQLIQLAHDYPIDVRFIEMMPIGYGKKFKTINHLELIQQIQKMYPSMKKDHRVHGYGPAVYYQIDEFLGSIGFISAIHDKFCASCNRVRLTSQGYLKTCLCYDEGIDLRSIIRQPISDIQKDEQLQRAMKDAIFHKPLAHCFENQEKMTEQKDMVMIGG